MWKGKFPPFRGLTVLTMVINHLLNGMILQAVPWYGQAHHPHLIDQSIQAISLPIQGGCRVVSGSLKKAGFGKRVATRVSMEVIVIS